ncbi:hypothetical protein QE439_003796 [Pedobacter agri]|nr:hypothetical protein [Pedobacter agri]
MSGKIVKALISATQVPMKNRKGRVALDSGGLKVFAQALTFSLSIISYAGEQGASVRASLRRIRKFNAVAIPPLEGAGGGLAYLRGQLPTLFSRRGGGG